MMEIVTEIIAEPYVVKFSAKEGEEVLGWAYLYCIFNARHKEPYGLLENVYVEQEYRGQGIGTALARAVIAEARARGCYKIICAANLNNQKVHKLYEGFGFKKQGYEFRLDFFKSPSLQRD